ncbi:MAG: class I SAM-dependent methyltransferase [Fidelibacterota bacterium]
MKSQIGTHFLDFKLRELNHVVEWITNRGGQGLILDLGCSTGFTTRHLANRFGSSRVHGADINLKSVNKCRCRYNDIRFHYVDRDFFTNNNCKFGTVLLSHVLEHVNRPVMLLNRVKTLLDDNGTLIVSVPQERIRGDSAIPENFYNLLRLKFENVHRAKYTIDRLNTVLSAAGLKSCGYQYVHSLWENGNMEHLLNHSLIVYTQRRRSL